MTALAFFDAFHAALGVVGWPLAALLAAIVVLRLWRLDRDTRLHAALMFAFFFLVIALFWMLKPVKKALLLAHHADGLQLAGQLFSAPQVELLAKGLNMLVALAAALVFSVVALRLRRARFVAVVVVGFALLFGSLALSGEVDSTLRVWTLYVGGDLFVTAMVAAFFAFLNDSEDPLAARRLYGLICLGGVLGGAFGSTVLAGRVLSWSVGASAMAGWTALGCLVILALALAAGRVVARHVPPDDATEDAVPDHPRRLQAAFAGASATFHSRYLLRIVAIVGLYEMVSTLVDFQFTATVLHFVEPAQRGRYFTDVFAFTNIVALVVQLLLTPFVLRRLGVGAGVLWLPVLLTAAVLGFWAAPVLLLASLLSTADNAFAYSLNQSAKEILYVPLARDGKYRAKAFIDIFVLRCAKALAVLLSLLISAAFVGFSALNGIILMTLLLLGIWLYAARALGREYGGLEAEAVRLADAEDRCTVDERRPESAWVPTVT